MSSFHRYLGRLHDTISSRQEIQNLFPHHKHMVNAIVAAQPPDLSEVLREIDGILYNS